MDIKDKLGLTSRRGFAVCGTRTILIRPLPVTRRSDGQRAPPVSAWFLGARRVSFRFRFRFHHRWRRTTVCRSHRSGGPKIKYNRNETGAVGVTRRCLFSFPAATAVSTFSPKRSLPNRAHPLIHSWCRICVVVASISSMDNVMLLLEIHAHTDAVILRRRRRKKKCFFKTWLSKWFARAYMSNATRLIQLPLH